MSLEPVHSGSFARFRSMIEIASLVAAVTSSANVFIGSAKGISRELPHLSGITMAGHYLQFDLAKDSPAEKASSQDNPIFESQ
jgi:hypothetical protein